MAKNYTMEARMDVRTYICDRHRKQRDLYEEFKDDPEAQSKLRGHIDYLDDKYGELSLDDIYVVWFCYILGGWKALCSTEVEDGKYYEVTHDEEHDCTYVDEYVKKHQEVFYKVTFDVKHDHDACKETKDLIDFLMGDDDDSDE